MHRALYRKWRPADFDDVWGQDQVTNILKYEVATEKFSHAYLFCGTRGTGKTSSAKILAKAVNCLAPRNGNPCNECAACRSIDAGVATDVIEMDAASNTSVEAVRDIRDEIVFTPAELKYRVYIIDEVHMISGNAFNALLKTLEEPPAHVIFILATTELHKLPSTIVSRCQRFDFRRISGDVLARRLLYIAEKEEIELTEGGARLLARLAVGGMRDAISLLELCAGMKQKIDEELVATVCGGGDRMAGYDLVEAVLNRDYAVMYRLINDLVMSSRDLSVFWRDFMDCYRDMMVMKTANNAAEYLDLTDAERARLSPLAARFTVEQLAYQSRLLEEAMMRMQRSGASRRTIAELTLTRLCEPKLSTGEDALLARVGDLEAKLSVLLAGGTVLSATQSPEASAPSRQESSAVQEMPVATVEPAPSATVKAAPTSPTYRPFCGWSEVLEEMSRLSPPLAGVLRGSRAALADNGLLIVSVSNVFSAKALSREENIQMLRTAATAVAGVPITAVEVKNTSDTQNNTILKELERALAECK